MGPTNIEQYKEINWTPSMATMHESTESGINKPMLLENQYQNWQLRITSTLYIGVKKPPHPWHRFLATASSRVGVARGYPVIS